MPAFTYTARNANGELKTATIEARDRATTSSRSCGGSA